MYSAKKRLRFINDVNLSNGLKYIFIMISPEIQLPYRYSFIPGLFFVFFGRSFLVLNRDTLGDVKIIHILFFLLNHGQREITPVSSTSQMKRGKIPFNTHPSKLGNNYEQCHDFPFKQRFGRFLTADLQQYFFVKQLNRITTSVLDMNGWPSPPYERGWFFCLPLLK